MAESSTDEASRVALDAWLVTDVGVVRDHNEDSAFMEPTKGFFIVADGMGGHAAGEVASAMAVETVRKTLDEAHDEIDAFKKSPSDPGRRGLVQLLQNAVLAAHQAVYQRGQTEQDKAGMGTTLDVVLVAGPEAFVAHVGDSRTYLIREGKPSQITTDHTVAEVLVIEGKLTIEEAQVSPLRTILVNAIGVSADVGVEMAHVTLRRGDRLLLCSDGLHDYFPMEDEIAERLSAPAPGAALKEMVELAKSRGGHDNITGVTIHILDIVDGVVEGVATDATQPVEVANNPFADEPTETSAVSAIPGRPPRMVAMTPQTLRQTQPMRAVGEEEESPLGRADTIPPPPDMPKELAQTPKVASKTGKADAADKTGDKAAAGDKAEDASPTEKVEVQPTPSSEAETYDPEANKPKASDKSEKKTKKIKAQKIDDKDADKPSGTDDTGEVPAVTGGKNAGKDAG